jgi:large subunit ribosomal protein LP2
MKHLAAFALLVLGGNESPSAADVEALLKKSGVSADSAKIEAMIKAFEGKKFHEAVEAGLAKMATMGGGGGGAPAAGGAV